MTLRQHNIYLLAHTNCPTAQHNPNHDIKRFKAAVKML